MLTSGNVDEVARSSDGQQIEHKRKCLHCNRKHVRAKRKAPARNATCFVCKLKCHYSNSAECKGKQTQPLAADELAEGKELGNLYLGSDFA